MSRISAGNDVKLKAEDEIRLLAAKNQSEQHSSNQSSSASIGVSIGTGGLLFNVGASRARGNEDGNDGVWSTSQVSAGKTLTIESGGDTTLKGAVASGEQVVAKIGGNLSIESVQDTSQYDSKEQSLGGSISIGLGGVSGNLSASQSKVTSDYASVARQSGIKAGDGGFQVEVKGTTDLKGAVIASTEQAVQDGKNRFATAGLTLSDIANKAEYEASSTSVNFGSSMSFAGKLALGGTGVGIGTASGSAASTTQSGISGIAGNQAVRSGDAETGIGKIFDAEKVKQDIAAQVQITQLFGQQASLIVDNYAENQMNVLRARYTAETDPEKKKALQDEVDSLRLETEVMNVLIGAVTSNGASALTRESLSAAAEEMRKITHENSMLFDGIIDESVGGNKPFVLSNVSGISAGGKWDLVPFKGAGTRVSLDNICSTDNSRCKTNNDGSLALKDGKVQWDKSSANGQTLPEYLASEEGQKAAGAAGGIQGWKGTLLHNPYAVGSWQD